MIFASLPSWDLRWDRVLALSHSTLAKEEHDRTLKAARTVAGFAKTKQINCERILLGPGTSFADLDFTQLDFAFLGGGKKNLEIFTCAAQVLSIYLLLSKARGQNFLRISPKRVLNDRTIYA